MGCPKKTRVLITKGTIKTIYEDQLGSELHEKLGGNPKIYRASHVEAPEGNLEKIQFDVDLTPSKGPVLTGFKTYNEAVAAEVDWLQKNTLNPKSKNQKA